MEITEVRMFLLDRGPLRAIVSITLDNCFVIRDLKIIRGSNGHFVEMPTKWQGDRRFEIASTITTEARKMLEDKVFAEYEKLIGESVTRRKLSTYVILWDSRYYDPIHRSYDYVDAFVNLEECKKAKQQRLEDEVWSQVSNEDGIRIRRQKMSQTEIEKYKKQHPYELDRVVTDGQIKRDSLGLVPIDPEFARELKQKGAPDLPTGSVGKREWVRKPSYLEIQRNDGKRLVYEWICVPDTIDPR